MSVYSGFCTRKQESVYNKCTIKMIELLQKFILKTLTHQQVDLDKFKEFFTKIFVYMTKMEENKYHPPRYTEQLQELATHFNVQVLSRDQSLDQEQPPISIIRSVIRTSNHEKNNFSAIDRRQPSTIDLQSKQNSSLNSKENNIKYNNAKSLNNNRDTTISPINKSISNQLNLVEKETIFLPAIKPKCYPIVKSFMTTVIEQENEDLAQTMKQNKAKDNINNQQPKQKGKEQTQFPSKQKIKEKSYHQGNQSLDRKDEKVHIREDSQNSKKSYLNKTQSHLDISQQDEKSNENSEKKSEPQ